MRADKVYNIHLPWWMFSAFAQAIGLQRQKPGDRPRCPLRRPGQLPHAVENSAGEPGSALAMHNTFSEHWLFQDMSSEARSALYALGEVLEISTDQVVIEANTPNHQMYLLLEGAFRVNLPDRPGRVGGFTLGHRGPGDLVGDYSFFDAFMPSARVTASTPGLVKSVRSSTAICSPIWSAVYVHKMKSSMALCSNRASASTLP